ncbi:hypothetical protein ACJJIX_15935 [Microbulbifer sp. VAAC004]|uniref:hypothetical protein n=1 Tax=unclassified Microbulbifer TaxID=2619833 RepID=UPI004039A7CF
MLMNKIICVIYLLFISHTTAACYVAAQTKEQKFDEAEKVFVGKLLKAELAEENPTYMELKLTYKVKEGFKGQLNDKEVVYTAIDLAACGLGASGFYGDQVIFTGSGSQTQAPPSFTLDKSWTPNGFVYSRESLEWLEYLRSKNHL